MADERLSAVADETLAEPADGELTQLLRMRRSVKRYREASIPLGDVSSFLWSVAGENSKSARVHGSAHASYPVSTTLVAGAVDGLPVGAYRYMPQGHRLTLICAADQRRSVAAATLDAAWLEAVPAIVMLSANLTRAREQFLAQGPARGARFAAMEIGLMSQGGALCASALGLGTTLIAGLDPTVAADQMRPLVPQGHEAMALLPLGRPIASDSPEA